LFPFLYIILVVIWKCCRKRTIGNSTAANSIAATTSPQQQDISRGGGAPTREESVEDEEDASIPSEETSLIAGIASYANEQYEIIGETVTIPKQAVSDCFNIMGLFHSSASKNE